MQFLRDRAIILPTSKSIGARYLVCSFFSGTLPLTPEFDDSDDLMAIRNALLNVVTDEEPIDYGETPLDVNASGTALRFVLGVAASTPAADFVILGTDRLMERPVLPLLKVLRSAGADIEALGKENRGPYKVKGKNLKGETFDIEGNVSSQFISAVMLVAPTWEKGVTLNFTSDPVSFPYIEMTARVMEAFGVKPEISYYSITVKEGKYRADDDFIPERDWSAAGFFYEATSFSDRPLFISELSAPSKSMQGDSDTAEIFSKLGVTSQFSDDGVTLEKKQSPTLSRLALNLKDNPDLVPALTMAAILNGVDFEFTGIANLRLKESDRLEVLKKECAKIGFLLKADDDSLRWDGERCDAEENPVIETYDDHRIAMCFAVTALKLGHISVRHPEVVAKSYGDFWAQMPKLGLHCMLKDDVMTIERDVEPNIE